MPENLKFLDCDICIIGAGSAGLSVASGAAQLGMDVILIERGKMGGDCLNTGCVPSKALLSAAKHLSAIKEAAAFGLHVKDIDVNFNEVKAHIQNAISTIEPHDSIERFESLGVRVISESASFEDENHIITKSHRIKSKYFVIASGGRAAIPDIKGLESSAVLTNETIFSIDKLPKELVIIGGGPIGIEMAFAFHQLGTEVTVLEAGKILSHDDDDLKDILRRKLINDGIKIYEDIQIRHVQADSASQQTIFFTDSHDVQHELSTSHILVAAGRTPNIESLNLDRAHIEFSKKGISVNARLRTNKKHIYAIGDVVMGAPQFTHVAGYHAGIVIQNVCFKLPAKVNYSALPWVTYTTPEFAHTGMTLKKAQNTFGSDKIDTQFFKLIDIDRAIAEGKKDGGIKIIYKKSGKIVLGVSILAPHAGEMISLWSYAISNKAKLKDIASLIIAYPTYQDLSKRAASSVYSKTLFSPLTRKIVKFLNALF